MAVVRAVRRMLDQAGFTEVSFECVGTRSDRVGSVWVVTVHDKEAPGEPDVGIAIVSSSDDVAAAGDLMLDELLKAGRCRCAVSSREVQLGVGVRVGALIRPPVKADA